MFEQKDIVLVPFPYSDLTGSKLRPALIVSNEVINSTEDRICCLVTSNPPKDKALLLNSFHEGQLPFKSWVKPHRIFTIHEKIIKKKLCSITDVLHRRVVSSINDFLR